jgi:hypothetical protein
LFAELYQPKPVSAGALCENTARSGNPCGGGDRMKLPVYALIDLSSGAVFAL